MNDEKVLTNDEWQKLLNATFKKINVPYLPSMQMPEGILLDFAFGARLYVPPCAPCSYRLELFDLDHQCKLSDVTLDPGDYFVSDKKYFVRFGVQVTRYPSGEKVFQHRFDAEGKNVAVNIPVDTLGDTIAWFQAALKFQKKHLCNLTVRVADYIKPIFEPVYPDVNFVSREVLSKSPSYAQYTLAVFHKDKSFDQSPVDYRQVPLCYYGDEILGVSHDLKAPEVAPSRWDFDETKSVHPGTERHLVAIATQASGGVKMWQHPMGWDKVIDYLVDHGYDVIDIDRDYMVGKGIWWNRIPRQAINCTGNVPLTQRVAQIQQADFFIGLGSGLSWLAWCCGVPVVLISGFSEKWEEFPTPYRINNPHVCHGCFNDTSCLFDHKNFLWCPRHQDTERHWECTKAISPESVIAQIEAIPEFMDYQDYLKYEVPQLDKKGE